MLPLLLIAAFGLAVGVTAQEAKCYAPNGDLANNETYVPCNKLGINQAGVFSSCCALDGEPSQRDICSTSGLCINRQGQPQRGFCTDETWNSKACVHVCMTDENGQRSGNSTFMTACNDGTATYCCGSRNTTCCGTNEAITIQTQESVCTANSTSTEADAPVSSAFKSATIALAAVAGVSLLAGLISTLWLLKQNKSLKQQLAEKPEPSPPRAPDTPAQTVVESQYTGNRSSYASPQLYKPSYGTPPPQPLSPSSEYYQGNVQRYSELDASGATARSEMGSPTPYEQQQYQSGRDSPALDPNNTTPMGSPRFQR
ncbi:hypothetical protein Cob_v003413 [Colletotrichum orbiculare MAFF 240422]|uniref:Uncharacterized protein n=1 Tax=Colletotrichum orbiculare (strain 104-T / ATCC 96160 / CBS 514.97 / LARS 414 / MAFF 240422) TaxID=1213857 RepID=N4VXT8_COLOR|nr:hypothetical protein Cob_v003413 [Colletotrichum orbiculare MAFF 240422]